MTNYDGMSTKAFGRLVLNDWAISRFDVGFPAMGNPVAVRSALPVELDKVLEWLKVSNSELITLMSNGDLVRPGRRADSVAWRRDEVEILADRVERFR
ncbi:MAG: hypothetical protein ABL904_15940 [Hyphomicrobiaceae bacterium]